MKRALFSLLFLCFCVPAYAVSWIAIFGSADCTDCARVKREWKQYYALPEGPVLIFLPIEDAGNYAYLKRLEKAFQPPQKGASFPIFLVGKRFITSLEDFEAHENDYVDESDLAEACPETAPLAEAAGKARSVLITYKAPEEQTQVPQKQSAGEKKLAFFEQKNCAKCSRQEKELNLLCNALPDLQLTRFDVATPEGMAMLARFRKVWGLENATANLAPMVCWCDGYITGHLAEALDLMDALSSQQTRKCFWEEPLTDAEISSELNRKKNLLGWAIVPSVFASGLFDGINPCAFATSIFLISYLLMHKRRKRDIALTGGAFCLGVFLAYLLFGLGLSFVIDFLNQFHWLKLVIYGACGILALCLAFGHARDAWKFKKSGKTSDMSLGLSKDTHKGIHEKIRKFAGVKSWVMLPAAVLLGIVVSSMELACTGQIYLPTLVAINANGMNWTAFLLLLLYNLCFIVPLALVTILACYGVGAKSFADWSRRNVVKTKLLMALLFTVIAGIMAYIVLAD